MKNPRTTTQVIPYDYDVGLWPLAANNNIVFQTVGYNFS